MFLLFLPNKYSSCECDDDSIIKCLLQNVLKRPLSFSLKSKHELDHRIVLLSKSKIGDSRREGVLRKQVQPGLRRRYTGGLMFVWLWLQPMLLQPHLCTASTRNISTQFGVFPSSQEPVFEFRAMRWWHDPGGSPLVFGCPPTAWRSNGGSPRS